MTKLQKLLYIVYGAYLRLYKSRLTDEHPKAWPYGPVFPVVRDALLAVDLSSITTKDSVDDNDVEKIVSETMNTFGMYNSAKLSHWSHQSDSPWSITTQKDSFSWNDEIDDTLIYDYFGTIMNDNVKIDG